MNKTLIHCTVLTVCLLLSLSAQSQRHTLSAQEVLPHNPERKGKQGGATLDSCFDANILVPHWDAQAKKWGYIRRGDQTLLTGHRFWQAGKFGKGFALAIELGQDSMAENIYRIDSEGATTCIFSDTTSKKALEPSSYYETRRTFDDYVFIKRGRSTYLISPTGKLLWDTLFNQAPTIQRYEGGGYCRIRLGEFDYFIAPDGKINAKYNLLDFSILSPPSNRFLYHNGISIYQIKRLIDQKIGFIDGSGNLIVPMVWDTIPLSIHREESGERTVSYGNDTPYYDPTMDSTFLGWRDGAIEIAHLDGRAIYRFPAHSYPLGSRTEYWREQGLFAKLSLAEDGKFLFTSYFDPLTGKEKIVSNGSIVIFDEEHAATVVSNFARDSHSGTYYQLIAASDSSRSSFETFERNKDLRLVDHCKYDGHYYHVVIDHWTRKYGLIDQFGKIVIPIRYDKVIIVNDANSDYPWIAAWDEGKSKTKYLTLSPLGNLLFAESVRNRTSSSQSKFPDPKGYFGNQAGNGLLDFSPIRGNCYSNLLWFQSSSKRSSKIKHGYVDSYGNRYY